MPGDQAVHGVSTSIFIELKREGGKLNANQEEMKARLLLAGCHCDECKDGRTGSRDTDGQG